MAGPKPAALPLGDGPTHRLNCAPKRRFAITQIVTHNEPTFVNRAAVIPARNQRGKIRSRCCRPWPQLDPQLWWQLNPQLDWQLESQLKKDWEGVNE